MGAANAAKLIKISSSSLAKELKERKTKHNTARLMEYILQVQNAKENR